MLLTFRMFSLFPVLKVNAEKFDLKQSGFLIVTVDACSGKVTNRSLFTTLDTKMEQYFKTGIKKR